MASQFKKPFLYNIKDQARRNSDQLEYRLGCPHFREKKLNLRPDLILLFFLLMLLNPELGGNYLQILVF